jgi:hypothetical protein
MAPFSLSIGMDACVGAQTPFPPRSLVRDGQTSPNNSRQVVSHSTCLPLSPSPLANSFILGTAVINNNKPLVLRDDSQTIVTQKLHPRS